MISEWEIWACANQLIQRYGFGAGFHAAQRADELVTAGDHDGQRAWLMILKRIEALTPLTPEGRVH